jgi:hypothetical protein
MIGISAAPAFDTFEKEVKNSAPRNDPQRLEAERSRPF